ncbi:MAG: hypothetical protein H0X29_05085 [Parachlamydiaceae bacterium]|nr:hypothetical protein [Parachlamydiaceae bacterium]
MSTPPPELQEKDFIQEGYKKNPFPFWLWLFLLTVILALLWGGSSWYSGRISTLFKESPFLQVTNRQVSLFLWQNPEFMRINSKQKSGYLTGFQYVDNVTMELASADHYVDAPPELLFRYHTWSRLVKDETSFGKINQADFHKFLDEVPEWQPPYWPAAPKEYVQMVQVLASRQKEDLNTLEVSDLPTDVRIAFQGWKNYFKDGEAINQVKPTLPEMRQFLVSYPHYARNFWRNIVANSNPDYLKNLSVNDSEGVVPANAMSPFLKVAIFNYLQDQDKKIEKEVPKMKREVVE